KRAHHSHGNRHAVRTQGIIWRVSIFNVYRCVALELDIGVHLQRRGFAVNDVLRDAIECRDSDEQWSELRMIYDLRANRLGSNWRFRGQPNRDHWRGWANISPPRGNMVAVYGAEKTAGIDNFCRSHIRRQRGENAAARHRQLHIAQIKEWVAAEKHFIALDGRDGAS